MSNKGPDQGQGRLRVPQAGHTGRGAGVAHGDGHRRRPYPLFGPLDGGRILWLALAWLTEPYTAQRVLSAVSLAVSLALLLGGGGLIWRLGGSPFLLVGAVGLTGWNLREIKLAKGG